MDNYLDDAYQEEDAVYDTDYDNDDKEVKYDNYDDKEDDNDDEN